VLVALAVLAVCAGAFMLAGASDQGSEGKAYKIKFDNAFGLVKGGDFRVGGVNAGQTTGFEVEKKKGESPKAVVTVEVSKPGFGDFRKDASCEIRPQSLIGEYYVDCQPGKSDEKLRDGGVVPVEQTSSTIPTDIVNDIMRRPYRERLRLIVGELGAGLAGRPGDLSAVLRRAHPALRETSQTLRILGRQTKTIKKFIGDAHTVVAALEDRKKDVSRFVREAGRTAAISASRRDDLGQTFHKLPVFLAELEPYMNRLGDLTKAQTPVLRNLQSASGELETFLTRLRPFAEEGTPAFKALGDMSVVGHGAVRKTEAEVAELRRLAKDAPGFAKPLRQFLQTIDDRARAVEPDQRAAASGPPAGDKTHTSSRRAGFTGMEAIWNYFFWQTLSTNPLDDTGHVLRLGIVVNPICGSYQVKPSASVIDQCNQFMGPTQPGVTTADPTRPGGSTAASAASASSAPSAESPAPDTAADNTALDYLLGK
jgi:virulence factor Mce-like protein